MAYEVITLNLIPSGDVPVIHAAQYDKNRPLNFALKWGDDDFYPSGYDLELQIRKVDNNIVTVAPSAVNNNVVTFLSTEQMTACSGSNLGEIQITKDDLDIATLHFYLVVQRDVLAGGMTSASDIHNLEEQIEELLPEALGNQYYTKDQTNTLLDGKADVSDIPDMSDYYTKSETYSSGEVNTLLSAKADTSALATVATTGNYNDLTNKPSLAAVATSGLYSDLSGTPNLATVATSGSYNDLTNKPTIISYGTELPMSDTDNNKVTDVINAICELPTVKSSSGSIATFDTDLTENLVECVVDNSATKLVNVSGNVTDLASYIRGIYQGNYGFVDLGSLTWSVYQIDPNAHRFQTTTLLPMPQEYTNPNMLCSDRYTTSSWAIGAATNTDLVIYKDSAGHIFVNDMAYSDANDFKTSLNGVYLIYELSTPTTPTITQAQLTAICTAWGVSGVVADLPNYPITYNGNNNVFTDSGNISVKYLESIGKAISE